MAQTTEWPTTEEITKASDETLIRWNIELPAAKTDAEREALKAISGRIRMMTSYQHMSAQQKVTGGG